MASIEFTIQGRAFKLESNGNGRRILDKNGVEWSDPELVEFAGEVEATTAIAYAQRDLERTEDRDLSHTR